MRKMKTLYKLDANNKHKAINEVLEGSEWVIEGKGDPYMKLNGTACAIINGIFYRRLQVKNSQIANELVKSKGYILCDKDSGDKYYGWLPVDENDKQDKIHMIGWKNLKAKTENGHVEDGTYELVGEKVQTNDYKLDGTYLIKHLDLKIKREIPTDFDGLKEFLNDFVVHAPEETLSAESSPYRLPNRTLVHFNGYRPEGIVWHWGDKMVKIRRKDFY